MALRLCSVAAICDCDRGDSKVARHLRGWVPKLGAASTSGGVQAFRRTVRPFGEAWAAASSSW
eukprot:13758429-Alexandrium_andersonii.AAC.1